MKLIQSKCFILFSSYSSLLGGRREGLSVKAGRDKAMKNGFKLTEEI